MMLTYEKKDDQYARHIRSEYGLEVEQYNRILKRQGCRCGICNSSTPRGSKNGYFVVDHDHVTGKTRGLLCHACNTAIGVLGDDLQSLLRAVRYLARNGNSISPEIRVYVIDYGRKSLYMRYKDPATGKQVSRSTGESDRDKAEVVAKIWERQLRGTAA